MVEFTNVDGRQPEARVMAIEDLVLDAEKPHERAVPIVWIKGELAISPQSEPVMPQMAGRVYQWGYLRTTGQPYYTVTLKDIVDEETDLVVNAEVYSVYGLGQGDRFSTLVTGIEEVAFLGWSLDFLTEEEKQEVLEEMA